MKKKIEILGGGCAKCGKLYELTKKAVEEAGIEADIVKVEEIAEILRRGVMATPALVVDGKVKISGGIPSLADLKKMIA